MLDDSTAVLQVVRRRQAQRLLQLPRPPRRGRQRRPRRLPLARRGGRGARRHLRRPASRRPALRQRAEGPRRRAGRRRRDLPADDPRGRRRDARLRAHRRAAQRRLRRLLAPSRSSERMEVSEAKALDHRRRRAAQGQDRAGQAAGRRGDGRPRRRSRRSFVVRHTGADAPMTDGPRRLVPRGRSRPPTPSARPSRWTPSTRCSSSTRPARRRSPKGILHTTGGYLTGSRGPTSYVFDLKPESDVYWCSADVGWITGHSYIVYGPLANGATSRDVRGRAGLPATRTSGGSCRALRRDDLLHRADGDPRLHEVGRRAPGEARPVLAAAARARSASRSTRRRGSGTTRSSAASAARSSTPGGRPRRAAS